MLYNVVVVSAIHQQESVPIMCVSPPSPHLFHRCRQSYSAKLGSVLYNSFPPAICFIHHSVYMSIPLSQFVLPSPPSAMSTDPFSASPLLCK